MARTRIDLANLALALLVRDPIRDLEGNTPEQLHTKQFIEQAIGYVISEFQIPAARCEAQLVKTSTYTRPGWSYVYIRPADVVRIWQVGPAAADPVISYPYKEMISPDPSSNNTYIMSNVPDAWIIYSSSRVDLSRMTPQQFELAAFKLAELCCMPLKKDKELFAFLGQEVLKKTAHEAAFVYNAEVDPTDIDAIPEFIGVRSQ